MSGCFCMESSEAATQAEVKVVSRLLLKEKNCKKRRQSRVLGLHYDHLLEDSTQQRIKGYKQVHLRPSLSAEL
jgi:hypothetical protein